MSAISQTFTDQTEIGLTSEPVIKHDLKKYHALSISSRLEIQKAMMKQFDFSAAQYNDRINQWQKFRVDELLSFRTLLEFYQDRELYPQP